MHLDSVMLSYILKSLQLKINERKLLIRACHEFLCSTITQSYGTFQWHRCREH